jgi:hypothetical protein
MTVNASDIMEAAESVTKDWTKQRKAEERGRRSRSSRMFYSDRVNCTDVADEILPGAYDHASGGGKYTVSKRQLYYACRGQFRERTDRELEYNYFAGTLLVQYMNRHPNETAGWKITADPRGTLTIPNAHHEIRVPCGTLEIEEHLTKANCEVQPMDFDLELPIEWPSIKGRERYQAVLFVEKEGFAPLLEEAQIAERFDLAILSTKGQSVVAARQFVDTVCDVENGVPLFTVHDFDKFGLEIAQSLTQVSDSALANDRITYQFNNSIDVTDLGLRLSDVEKYGLGTESCDFKNNWSLPAVLTSAEREFLRSGQRVELNAFTSPQFIEWLENKLTARGLGKRLVPSDDVLESAYRRALAVAKINSVIENAVEEATKLAEEATIPKTLRRKLQTAMKRSQDAWDKALYRLAAEKIEDSDDE